MRDLRQAAGEGWHPFITSLAHFPKRHPFLIAGVAGALALIFLGAHQYQTERDVNVLRPQVTRIVNSASICEKLITPQRSELCAKRIRVGLEACRENARCRRAFEDVLDPLRVAGGEPGAARRRGPDEGGDASTPSTGHSPSGPSPGGPTDTPSKSHGPSVPHQSPHGHESGGGGAPAASPTPAPSSSPSQSPSSTVERSTETVLVQPPAPAPEAEPPARTAAGGLVEGVGDVVEGVGTTVEETGHGLNEVVGGLGCQLLHTC